MKEKKISTVSVNNRRGKALYLNCYIQVVGRDVKNRIRTVETVSYKDLFVYPLQYENPQLTFTFWDMITGRYKKKIDLYIDEEKAKILTLFRESLKQNIENCVKREYYETY